MLLVCPNCQAEISPEFRFCRECGTPLKEEVEARRPEAPPQIPATEVQPGVRKPGGQWRRWEVTKAIDAAATILLVIGGLNWGLVGLFQLDFVAALFGEASALSRIFYGLVGLCALYQARHWRVTSRLIQPEVRKPSRRQAVLLVSLLAVVIGGISAGLYYFGLEGVRGYLPFGGPSKPPVEAQRRLHQGMTYAALKDYDNAILEFTAAIEAYPRYAEAYANRGIAYIQHRRFLKALDDLNKAVQLNPRDKMAHYNLAALYSRQDERERALDALDKALGLGFDNYDALRTDPDLKNVRREAEFRRVLEKHKIFF